MLVLGSLEFGQRLEAVESVLIGLPAFGIEVGLVVVGFVVGSLEVRWTGASVELTDMRILLIRLALLAIRAGMPFSTTVVAGVRRSNVHHLNRLHAAVCRRCGVLANSRAELGEHSSNVHVVRPAFGVETGIVIDCLVVEVDPLLVRHGRMKRGEMGLKVVEVGRVAANVIRQVFDNVLRHSTLVNPGIELLNVLMVEALQSFRRLERGTVAAHVVQGLEGVPAHVVLFDGSPEQRADGSRLTSQLVAKAVFVALVVQISQDILNAVDVLEGVVQQIPEVNLRRLVQGLALDRRSVWEIRRVSGASGEGPRAVSIEAAIRLSGATESPFAAIAFVVSFGHQEGNELPFYLVDGLLRSRGQALTEGGVKSELHWGGLGLGHGSHLLAVRERSTL